LFLGYPQSLGLLICLANWQEFKISIKFTISALFFRCSLEKEYKMKLRNLMMFPEESVYGIPSFVVDGLMRTKAQIDNEKLKMDNC
jgi:hypothetical protein